MHTELNQYIRRYIDITDRELELFHSYCTSHQLKKKDHLLQHGEICKARYFITKGCFRFYYFNKKGAAQTISFGVENWWISEYDSLLNGTPTRINIQALEDAEFLQLDEAFIDELFLKLPKVERLFRIIMEKTYVAAQRRIEYMMDMSGTELYNHFRNSNPEFIQRIPQKYLASYLGFTPEFLSMIRARKV